ncbi:unnamed protein product, partial [Didymodactylos carnosus]
MFWFSESNTEGIITLDFNKPRFSIGISELHLSYLDKKSIDEVANVAQDLKGLETLKLEMSTVEEQWAMFLRKLDDDTIPSDHAEEECNKLIDLLRKDYKEEKIIKNSYYHTVIANDIIMNEWSIRNSSKAKPALSHFEKAVQLDEAASGAAHLGIAWCTLIIQDKNYKKKALESFDKSLKILSNEMAML